MDLNHVRLDMHTRLIPIVGFPMDHSSASYVYNYLFQCYEINAVMWPYEIQPEQLAAFLRACDLMHIDRFTLTMPLKTPIIPLLDEVDACSRLFKSVNVVKKVDGRYLGSGFDGKGCMGALQDAGISVAGKRVLILGAGSISGIIGYELARLGAGRLSIANRTFEKACHIAQTLKSHTGICACACTNGVDQLSREAEQADLVIQCSALGMYGFGADYDNLSFLQALPNYVPVMEAIVNPPRTRFLSEAERLGHPIVMGMDMLVSQMQEIFDFWFGIRINEQERSACRRILMQHFGY